MFASTRLVYGKPLYLPVDEEHPLNPESMYAVHKITVEHYLRVLRAQRGLRYCAFRLSNPYGPFQENNGKAYGVINRFLRAAALGEEILVYGDGGQQRDYIHVDDVTAAFLLAAMNPRCDGQVFNLGGSSPVSIATAAHYVCTLANSKLRFVPWPDEYRVVETGDYVTDTRKLSEFIQPPAPVVWEQGLAGAFQHYRREAARLRDSASRRGQLRPIPAR
jgi:nucleoside-diphosphate-sugar epimerase